MEEIYEPFRNNLLPLHKPVMLAEFGFNKLWRRRHCLGKKILVGYSNRYPEIKSVYFS